MRRIRHNADHESGASAVEYGLLIAGIAAVVVTIVFALGVVTKNLFSQTATCISEGTSSTC